MVFTLDQDAFILVAHFRSAFQNEDGSWSYSLQSCIEQYIEAFPDEELNYDEFVEHRSTIVKRFEEKHCVCEGKSNKRSGLTKEQKPKRLDQLFRQAGPAGPRKETAQTKPVEFIDVTGISLDAHQSKRKGETSRNKPNERVLNTEPEDSDLQENESKVLKIKTEPPEYIGEEAHFLQENNESNQHLVKTEPIDQVLIKTEHT